MLYLHKKLQAVKKKHSPNHHNAMPQSIPYPNVFRTLCDTAISSKTDYSVPPSCRNKHEQHHIYLIQATSLQPQLKSISSPITSASTCRWRFAERKVGCCYGMYQLHVSSRYVVARFQKSFHSPETSSPWNPRVSALQAVHENPLSSHTFHPGSLSFPNGRSIFFGAMCCSVR